MVRPHASSKSCNLPIYLCIEEVHWSIQPDNMENPQFHEIGTHFCAILLFIYIHIALKHLHLPTKFILLSSDRMMVEFTYFMCSPLTHPYAKKTKTATTTDALEQVQHTFLWRSITLTIPIGFHFHQFMKNDNICFTSDINGLEYSSFSSFSIRNP